MGRYARRLINEAKLSPQKLLAESRFWKIDVFWELLSTVSALLSKDPAHALTLAELGPGLVSKLSVDEPAFSDLRAQALGRLGSAYRASTRYAEAEQTFDTALALPTQPLTRADNLRRLSYLRSFQDRHTEALQTATDAIEILKPLDSCLVDRHPIGLALLARAYAYYTAGNPAPAVHDLSAAVALLDARKDSDYYFFALHNLAVVLAQIKSATSEQLGQAMRYLAVAQRNFRHYSRPHIAKYKLRWLQALIARRLGSNHQAEGLLRTARAGFLKVQAVAEMAHVSLDFADLLLFNGKAAEARKIIREAFQLGKQHNLPSGALGALDLWTQATDAASRETIRRQLLKHLQPHGVQRLAA